MSLVGPKYREGWFVAGGILAVSVIVFGWLFGQVAMMDTLVLTLLFAAAFLIAVLLEDLKLRSTLSWSISHVLGLSFISWLTFGLLSEEKLAVTVMIAVYAWLIYFLAVAVAMAYRLSK